MNIVLFGDYCLDRFVECESGRLAPEAPVPVVVPTGTIHESAGMVGNVMNNLLSLRDPADLRFAVSANYPQIYAIKTRYIDSRTGHHFLRVDEGSQTDRLDTTGIKWKTVLQSYPDAVVLSDYCKGYLAEHTMGLILGFCQEALVPCFLDTKRLTGPWAAGAILKINQHELEKNLSAGVRPWEHVSACIVTYGSEGMKLYDSKGMIAHEVNGPVVEVRDGAGCGDTVLAALVVAYLENGFDLKGAMAWADKAGRVAVSKRGVVAVRREEVK